MSNRVVGLGQATVNYLGVASRYVEPDNRRELRTFSIQGGGTVATALAVLANFGGTAATFVGKLSDDDFGRHIVRNLGAHGVDVAHVVVAPGFVSPFAFITVEEAQRRPAVYYTRGNVPALAPGEVDLAVLDGAALLLIDGHHVKAQVAAAERARACGVPVLLGAAGPAEGMGDLIALADTLLLTERFATELSPRGELEDSLAELHAMGPRTVVILLGEAGAIGLEEGVVVRQPAFAADVVDETGAADVYAGAFAYALTRGWPLERRMRFASVAAGLSCRALGRRAALPDLNETLLACGWRE
ncbi:MAG TPA: PfkB family carbohydrate kinase [Polyangia bacterium]|jgi:sugar/nucleoside kinase (ribokinase family)